MFNEFDDISIFAKDVHTRKVLFSESNSIKVYIEFSNLMIYIASKCGS